MAPTRVDPQALAAGKEPSALRALWAQARVFERAVARVEHDGRTLEARVGEPLAVSLLAAGRDALARSVKFHRPRGPACMRGACEGCLLRVDGVPNAMACRVATRDGARAHSQNAFPSARLDVLRVTDWFFPRSFDHHHLMVRYGRTLNRAMQVFARRMAGLGTMPDADGPVPEAERWDGDVLVVGAGPAGLAAACVLARAGRSVLLVEEEPLPGGALCDETGWLASRDGARTTGLALAEALAAACREAGVTLRCGASAVATFDEGTLISLGTHALWARARARVFANGAHEVIDAVENNDLPGVYTARAAARALSHGVCVGRRVALVGAHWPSEGLARALGECGAQVHAIAGDAVRAVEGGKRATAVRLASGERVKCDAVLFASATAPAYELAGQAGVGTRWSGARGGFAPACGDEGETERDDVFVAGALRADGARALEPVDLRDPVGPDVYARRDVLGDGARVGRRVHASLRRVEPGAP